MRSLTLHSCVYCMIELVKTDKRPFIYFSAVALLHVACKISKNGFSRTCRLSDIIETILERDLNQCCSVLSRSKPELNTTELVELLQKTAVEHLTTYRQLEAREFGSVVRTVTTDFEALYAYKRGNYQRCLQLSTHNVHTLLFTQNLCTLMFGGIMHSVLTYRNFFS